MVVCVRAGQLLENLTSGGHKGRAQSQALAPPAVFEGHLHPSIYPSLPAHRAWGRTSSPREGAWRSQRDRKPPAPHREDWRTAQTAGTSSTSSLRKSLVPPRGQMYDCEDFGLKRSTITPFLNYVKSIYLIYRPKAKLFKKYLAMC